MEPISPLQAPNRQNEELEYLYHPGQDNMMMFEEPADYAFGGYGDTM